MPSEVSTAGTAQDLSRMIEELKLELHGKNQELAEAREQQVATAQILASISNSPTDTQRTFQDIAANAVRLCDANNVSIFQLVGDHLRVVAHCGPIPTVGPVGEGRLPLTRGAVVARAVLDREPVHVVDVQAETDEFPLGSEVARRLGYRTQLAVPLIREGKAIGVISIRRADVRPFTARQIELLKTFADQAVIAIENTRLFEEVQARTKELQEALEYQTATSDVLDVISRSPAQLQPVFDAIVHSATRLCGASRGHIFWFDGEFLRLAAAHGAWPGFTDYLATHPVRPGPGSVSGTAAFERRTVHVHDVLHEPGYQYSELISQQDFRTVLAVPMLREGALRGVIVVLKSKVEPFSDRQIELVETFADQAVIAIENTQLFEEVQARTGELTRSVAELKALGEVGQAVNSSIDLETVLSTIVAKAVQLSGTEAGTIWVFDEMNHEFRLSASYGMDDALIAGVKAHPIHMGDDTVVDQAVLLRKPVEIVDVQHEAASSRILDVIVRAGFRAVLTIPLLGPDRIIGALVVRRKEPGEFPQSTIDLLQTFGAQSVLAIQNARLFHEIEEKSRQLEIASQHKSQFVANMSHELRTPLAAMLGYAELLQEGIYGALPEKAPQVLARIQSNGKHLLGLINTVLDISKIESGQFKLNLSEYALSSMVETVRVATESLAAAKKLAFHVDVAKGLPHGLGDEQRLTQVLLNLVGNAIKFTDNGEVRIRASVADGRFTVAVSDTGPGIPPEERDRVFEKFHQIDNSSTRTKGGTGLGLAIAKDIVEMHGGRIWVESTLGKGATFRMELPVRAKPSEASAA